MYHHCYRTGATSHLPIIIIIVSKIELFMMLFDYFVLKVLIRAEQQTDNLRASFD